MAPSPITDDYYKVLEVEQIATRELITKSYKRLALKLHPDRNTKQDATEAFQLVCQGFWALVDHLYVLKLDIKARTSLRHIERRK